MNLLAIDYGTKNIGFAINNGTDIAFPFKTLPNNDNIIEEIKDICDEENIERVVLGTPTKRDRSEGDLAEKIKIFSNQLIEVGLDVVLEDELLSSSQTKDMMKNYAGKYEKDAIEATVILQTFLDRK